MSDYRYFPDTEAWLNQENEERDRTPEPYFRPDAIDEDAEEECDETGLSADFLPEMPTEPCPCCGAVVTETAKGFFCESRICRFGIWKDNRFFAQIGQSVNKSVVEALIRDGAAKLKGLRSKKTGRRYDATLKMMCGEQGVPRFQMEFEKSARKD